MAEDVAARFELDTVHWQAKLQADECFFTALREGLVNPLSPVEAYENIGGVVELILGQRNEFVCSEAVQLLLDLARHSDTTAVHPVLERDWRRLMAHLLSFGEYMQGQAGELASWYRRKPA
jgi:hypothetical protein